MNKYMTLFMAMLFLILITAVVDSAYNTSQGDFFDNPNADQDASIGGVFRMLGTFFKILTFQLQGIHPFISLFIFYPLTIMILFMIINVVKDMIPFT